MHINKALLKFEWVEFGGPGAIEGRACQEAGDETRARSPKFCRSGKAEIQHSCGLQPNSGARSALL